MISLRVKAQTAIQGDGEPSEEAQKLESALREFFKTYRADSGEFLECQVEVFGNQENPKKRSLLQLMMWFPLTLLAIQSFYFGMDDPVWFTLTVASSMGVYFCFR